MQGIRQIALLALLLTAGTARPCQQASAGVRPLPHRWLFIWRPMEDPAEVDRMIARFPRAHADGYNGVVFAANVPESKASALRSAAAANHLDLVPMVMGGSRDRNNAEGVLVKDALFIAHQGTASLQPDNNTRVVNGDFENATGNHFNGWGFQDDEGVTTFADHQVTHGGGTSLRMENVGTNPGLHCRIEQNLILTPHRQYRISFWLKTLDLSPAEPEVKVLTDTPQGAVSFGTFHADKTQDWTHYDLTFNSLNESRALLYLGTWNGKTGQMWWDDLTVTEVGLVNVLRRGGCPVSVRGENGKEYTEGRDFAHIVDPLLNPWQPYHDPPAICLLPGSRIQEAQRLRVSYYHPVIIYQDRVTSCLSEPSIFTEWRNEVKRANALLHPKAFFMEHDELRTINQCALCQAQHKTPGELLAWNVRKAAGIIRSIGPGAQIWVWSDMFDPMHNAVDHFFTVNGSLKGSWEGLDPRIGIVNWNGDLVGKNCAFFAKRGLRQILSGYYDGDEDGSKIAAWLAATGSVKGIEGAMYTTWEDRYDAMDRWAARAWRAGPKPAPAPGTDRPPVVPKT